MITSTLTKRWPRAGREWHLPGRRTFAGLVAATSCGTLALALTAGPAGAQTSPVPPQPGATLGVAGEGNERLDMFYTGTDRQVWMVHMSPMGQNVPAPLGGRLIGGPAAVWVQPGGLSSTAMLVVFGRGTDNALWWIHQTASGWSRWASLGGVLTSTPTAAAEPSQGSFLLVEARGSNGAVWNRTLQGPRRIWEPWNSIGGRLLPGTAPALAINGGGLFAAAVGTDRAVWVAEDRYGGPGFVWHSIGGRTTASPGIATPAESGAVVAFARGTDNAAWYKEFFGHTAGVTAGWHSLGGRLTSGVTALTRQEALQFGPTSVFALGRDNRAWMDSGTWPALTGWQLVRVG